MISATSRYISHQLVMSAWRRKPVVLFTILLVTILILFVQYTAVASEPKVQRVVDEPLRVEEPERLIKAKSPPLGHSGPNSDHMQGDAPSPQRIALGRPPQTSGPLPEPASAPPGVPLHRIVHFDLKGAPPKISYFKKVLPIIKEAGATGILLEYEDTFPFSGPLEFIRAGNAFKMEELEDLLKFMTSDLQLQVIPLIQTFGHMEYVLKFDKYRHLREVDEFPAVVCPSKNESFQLIKHMADQVMAVHSKFGARYLHIGCDEVFHIGECNLCQLKSRDDLLLGHMAQVASYVKKQLKVIPIVWDDMMRQFSPDILKKFNLDALVEPMVWTYVKDVYRFIPYSTWGSFGEVFPFIWAASAFKGAFGETLTVPNAKMHLDNNVAWLDVIQEQKNKFKLFRGIVITGWQRYDHFATLAELFPSGFPSLILNLVSVSAGGYIGKETPIRSQISKLLKCSDNQLRIDLEADEFLWNAAGRCFFPGAAVFRMTENHHETIKRANEYLEGVTINKAWLTDYNVRRNYTFIDRIDQGLEEYSAVYYSVTSLIQQARDALREVFDEYTVAEWIEQKIYPTLLKMEKLKVDADAMRRARTWSVRPLPVNKDLSRFKVGHSEL